MTSVKVKDSNLSSDEQQARWLAEASSIVKKNAFMMKRATDESNLRAALKYASLMLNELRTGALMPQKYYELYITVLGELRYLEAFFGDENKNGRSNRELYESVQHAGNVLPRLYLLFTAGSVYVSSGEAPAKDVIKDMVEMAKGVQHPTRGLFMRAYLLQVSKDKLPDQSTSNPEENGTLTNSVDFIIQNFTEMNKLWVRMQHQGSMAAKPKREKQRRELGELVGKNLFVLSQLEGMDATVYSEKVLPKIIEQLVNCKDEIAQQYLLDALVMVFPDDLHLSTIDALLEAIAQLQPTVRVHQSVNALISRLAAYATTDTNAGSVIQETNAYAKLSDAVQKLVESFTGLTQANKASMFSSLLDFVLKVYPNEMEKIDSIFGSVSDTVAASTSLSVGEELDPLAVKEIVNMLNKPLEKGVDILMLVGLMNAAKGRGGGRRRRW